MSNKCPSVRVMFLKADPQDCQYVTFEYQGQSFRFKRETVPGSHIMCAEHAYHGNNGNTVEFWWTPREILFSRLNQDFDD
jgi:hypothetical protein